MHKVKSDFVIPAQAGIHKKNQKNEFLDSRFRGNDTRYPSIEAEPNPWIVF